jgi:hypothetical protein
VSGTAIDRIVASPLTPLGRLRRALRDPVRTQRLLLRKLLSRAARTAWGREHGFARTLQYDDLLPAFQERNPLEGYDDIRSYVTRIRAGEADVLWRGRTRHFGISGGTVSSGELIPVSQEMLRALTRSTLTPGLQYASRGGGLAYLGGKILSIPGGVSEDPERPGVFVGEVSGLMAQAMPTVLARHFQAVSPELMTLEDWESKLQQIASRAAPQDVRAIVMVPSWAPLLFDILLARRAESQAGDRARVREVWPRLQVFFSGGVALRSYRSILEGYLGEDVDFIESYSASEGFFAFQDDVNDPDLLLHVDSGVFYEFVRLGDLDQDRPRRYTVADVEVGVDYALFVSTCSGLWGYGVGDVVRFTSTSPPRLRVVGRTVAILDEYGEALHADEIEQALATANRVTRAQCLHYHITYAPLTGPTPQHEWLLEFKIQPEDRDAFAAVCDRYLQEHNRHYRIRREPGVLAAPALTVLPAGSCLAYLRRTRKRLGAQTKLLPLSPQRDVADGLHQAADAREMGGEE